MKNLTLHYICYYVIYKEGIVCIDEGETAPLSDEAEFTWKFSRRKLKLTPMNLYNLHSLKAGEKMLHKNISWDTNRNIWVYGVLFEKYILDYRNEQQFL